MFNWNKIKEKINKSNVRWIRLQFCNPFGLIHQLSIPAYNKKTPQTKRIEYRPPDPTSNIYLVETAVLLAGLDGIKNKIQPPDPVDVNTYKLSDREMNKLSIKKLPTSLKEALSAINSDNEFLRPVIDEDFLEMYLNNLTKSTKFRQYYMANLCF